MTGADTTRPRPGEQPLRSPKLTLRHLERLAMVYVRQSTVQQMMRNQESTRLQYALVERAMELGFARASIVVIDDDLGRSGKSAEGRPGFQRLVAEVGLGHVGVILGIEVSRLARSCRDFYHLLEVCALFGTLICDQDGIYDPAQYNDRLVLGLKGTMSEAELHILKQRLLQGKLQKARRGELGSLLPIGYVRRPSGEVIKDPDEQVQAAVELIFEQFAARGTIHAVMRYMVDTGIRVPVRCRWGINKGDLEWQRPNRSTLSNLLHHPAYAGAYAYGRRRVDPRKQQAGRPSTGRTVAPREQWEALLMGRLPAYISWEQYEANQEQLARNQAWAQGTVRNGPSMLTGILYCGRCGRKMTVAYTQQRTASYGCVAQVSKYAEAHCQSLAARAVDECISELVLVALQPSSVEVSLRVAQDIQSERVRLEVTWLKQLERAQYEVDRALRQYNTVEPENRLVARTVEKQLEQKLSEKKALEQEYARVMAQQPTALSDSELTAIRELAADIPALWNAPTTTRADRQQIIRHLVDKIVLNVQGHSEKVDIQVQWAGGYRTETTVIRPVGRLEQLSYYSELLERVQSLQQSGLTAGQIAQQLNDEKLRPARRRSWNEDMVLQLCSRLRRSQEQESTISSGDPQKTQWTVSELARHLDMPDITLYAWLRRGWIRGQQRDDPHHTWVVDADPLEVSRLRALRNARRPPRPSQPSMRNTRIRA